MKMEELSDVLGMTYFFATVLLYHAHGGTRHHRFNERQEETILYQRVVRGKQTK